MEAELQDRVVAALDDEADWMGVAERLRRSAGARDVDPVWGIIEAFDYDLKDRSQSEQRERYGGPFGPMIETTAGAYPTLLSEVKDDRLQLWGELFDAVDHPLVRARFGDLIWSRRAGPAPYRRALAAAEAYVVLVSRVRDWLWK
jgi:hypothetical protein